MVIGLVLMKSPHLTKHAPDAGESARFQAVSSPQLFSQWTASPSLRPSAGNANRWVHRNELQQYADGYMTKVIYDY